ncbi:glycoside hydrolase family 47 protein [Calycina marina]|uniref:alpha-1,2-Mannosidase n=1 Tax=Calycina marina TaxID=1763456 RepID=A0A9P7YXC0_9HELO|nr:glycoside hydrolase family 47 protein [Calycina marina]
MPAVRRWRIVALSIAFVTVTLCYLTNQRNTWNYGYTSYVPRPPKTIPQDGKTHWSKRPERYPVTAFIPLPTGRPKTIPLIQTSQPSETTEQKKTRLERSDAVKASFSHSWSGYKEFAWLRDEISPQSGEWKDTFGGWAATLVDSLDTLWIMGMKDDFALAVQACEDIDFTTTEADVVNVFETTIRYMGGFLAAYDVSGAKYPTLLAKAVEVGELLMSVFDTPNRMPISRWKWKEYIRGEPQTAPERMLVSELGSLSLEFTRLTQLTGDPKFYDAVQRIADELEKGQNTTKLSGMWPVMVDASEPSFDQDNSFTLGGMSDSLYEYLPKQFLVLGGLLDQPKTMYENFIVVAKQLMFGRFYNPKNEPLLLSGDVRVTSSGPEFEAKNQHLTCFAGGMVGLASRIFNRPEDMQIAEELAGGCVWAYDACPHGIAPEIFSLMACPKNYDCHWSETAWYEGLANQHGGSGTPEEMDKHIKTIIANRKLPPGFLEISDRRYILRPEAIESVFIMWRITGGRKWQEAAWRMFQAIEKISRTEIAASALLDITVDAATQPVKIDSMESFWLAETLKYFYLCFQDFDVVSLDDFVLNTEAHPLRRPGR